MNNIKNLSDNDFIKFCKDVTSAYFENTTLSSENKKRLKDAHNNYLMCKRIKDSINYKLKLERLRNGFFY